MKITRRLANWLSGGELFKAHDVNMHMRVEIDLLNKELSTVKQLLADSELREQRLRAAVVQLRTENSDPSGHGRVGWQVSAFIPNSVLDKIRTDEDARKLVERTAAALVASAIKGIFKLNSKGHTTAIVWEPLGTNQHLLTGWFEGDTKKPGIIYTQGPAEIRLITGYDEADKLARQLGFKRERT